MNKKEVLELKNRLKKTGCTFTKMCGCYVNASKEIVVNFNETFLNLEEDEFYKYLEIAKKALSGTVGNNLLEVNFPMEEEEQGGKQQFLMGLRESKLKNEGLLETFYQLIIDNYDYAGNYLILVYHDAYDVMTKTSDNNKLDESEEVYEYILCAICPVTLTKPGLGYLEDVNKIGPRNRDWVVGAPDTGFIFPAFTDRSTDIHSAMFYTKNALEPHKELIEFVLGCSPKATATEQKQTFHNIIKNVINDSEKTTQVIGEIQENLSLIVEEQEATAPESEEPVILTSNSVQEILVECGVSEDLVEKIQASYEENFAEEPPVVEHLIDKKILAENEKNKATKVLVEQIQVLQERLQESVKTNAEEFDIVLKVKEEKVSQIKTQLIDGKKCIVIPVEEDEQTNINGKSDLSFLDENEEYV
ncbi:DUF4317 domain-containing protein [Candidatus Galacturonibacter soehngenii]|uniref:DUF4317 domain-containing protein n=1 Tax=Candidatus Galacturonatibacter soehngenii TaxID=2307010 RepID=A0A7V7QML3_9FIRM|nr:DUF4317 domain-containing protein [Candidatus Galacturonibacter soehngenii]KAB1439695.1 DUF4317 domain-containing protein [Candidatus Galacturonibacter soehngenii]MBA4687971.1 DUF4317 domain-containing protein [Candidatus Galacturonibacter soehngenii]